MNYRVVIVCMVLSICSFVASFGVTAHVQGRRRSAAAIARKTELEMTFQAERDALARRHAEELAALDAKVAAAEMKKAELAKRMAGRKKVINEDGRFMVPIEELDKFYVPTIIHKVEVTQNAKSFLNLTDDEYAAVQKLVVETWDAAMGLERANAVTAEKDGVLTIDVKAFGPAGEQLRRRFHSALLEILGSNRYAAFKVIDRCHYNTERMFVGFGRTPYRITVRNQEYPPGFLPKGRTMLCWKVDYPTADGKRKTWSGGSLSFSNRREKRLRAYDTEFFQKLERSRSADGGTVK